MVQPQNKKKERYLYSQVFRMYLYCGMVLIVFSGASIPLLIGLIFRYFYITIPLIIVGLVLKKKIIPSSNFKTDVFKKFNDVPIKKFEIFLEWIVFYLLVFKLCFLLPNHLINWADDFEMVYIIIFVFTLHLPFWILGQLLLSKQRLFLAIVALCVIASFYHMKCLLNLTFNYYEGLNNSYEKLFGVSVSPSNVYKNAEQGYFIDEENDGRNFDKKYSWIKDLSITMPNGFFLFYANEGSGVHQYQVLFSAEKLPNGELEKIDWNGYYYHGNHPRSILPDWILPLRTTPLKPRQFWIKRYNKSPTSLLFYVNNQGYFEYYSQNRAFFPWLLSLLPMFVYFLLRKRKILSFVISFGLVLFWCYLFQPWESWGIF